VHKISEALPGEVAVLVCAVLGNGVRWLRTVGGVTIGDTAVVVGPGPQGLAATVAAKESGARHIVVVGLAGDEARLAMAERLGATHTVAADRDDPHTLVSDLTDGAMADVVIAVTTTAASPPLALDLVGNAGTLVLGGGANQKPSSLMTDRITAEEITIRGVNTHDSPAVKQALSIAESGRYPLEEIVSHRFPLEEAQRAILTLAGEIPADGLIKVVMYPGE
jgi:alcohol dehydrogenase